MTTIATVRRYCLGLPEVVELPHHGIPSFRVAKKIFATVPDSEHLHVMLGEDEVEDMIAVAPSSFEKLFWGQQLAGVRVHLDAADRRLVTWALDKAWRRRAPARLIKPTN